MPRMITLTLHIIQIHVYWSRNGQTNAYFIHNTVPPDHRPWHGHYPARS